MQDFSSSGDDTSYQVYETKEPKRFGHFLQALKVNDGQSLEGTNVIDQNNINDTNNVPPSPVLSLQPDEDETVSVDISIPSTYSTLPPKKKQQLSMANLYVERIFRGFRKNFGLPTISSG